MLLLFSDIVPTRAVIAIMIFTACLVSYMLRVNMSINLIAMVEPSGSDLDHGVAECARIKDTNETEVEEHAEMLKSVPNVSILKLYQG